MLGVFFCYHEIHEKDTNKKSFWNGSAICVTYVFRIKIETTVFKKAQIGLVEKQIETNQLSIKI